MGSQAGVGTPCVGEDRFPGTDRAWRALTLLPFSSPSRLPVRTLALRTPLCDLPLKGPLSKVEANGTRPSGFSERSVMVLPFLGRETEAEVWDVTFSISPTDL